MRNNGSKRHGPARQARACHLAAAILAVALALVWVGLTGCGQKGPLYLPVPEKHKEKQKEGQQGTRLQGCVVPV